MFSGRGRYPLSQSAAVPSPAAPASPRTCSGIRGSSRIPPPSRYAGSSGQTQDMLFRSHFEAHVPLRIESIAIVVADVFHDPVARVALVAERERVRLHEELRIVDGDLVLEQ